MAYTDNFPQRPVFMADFANGGKIDPRATFSRSDTPPTYAAPSAVHYMSNEKHLSSENLIDYSNPVTSQWTETNTAITVNSTAAPDGTTTASNVLETAATGYHEVRETFACTNAVSHTATFYAKANGRTVIRFLPRTSSGVIALVEFTLSGAGSESLINGTATRSIAAVGSGGWYKLTVTFTGNATATGEFQINICESAGTDSYAGSATSGIYLWGAQVSTTGETVLNETSGSIHRQYASSLKSVSTAGQPRFEYGIDGQSMGVLIESQTQNLNSYSEDFSHGNYNKYDGSLETNAAIAPDGSLTADLFVEDTGTSTHYISKAVSTGLSVGSTQYAISVFAKAAGRSQMQMYDNGQSTPGTTVFDLANGTVLSGGGYIEACGNGWYRCTVIPTADYGTTGTPTIVLHNGSATSYQGDGYSGVLLWGLQLETGNGSGTSFSSSYIGTTTTSATRASDNLSVATADIPGFSEGVGTVVYETGGVASATGVQLAFTLFSASNSYITAGVNAGGSSDTSVRVYVIDPAGDQAWFSAGTATVGTGYKLACRYELDNVAASFNGGAVVSDTSGKVPVNVTSLKIGNGYASNYHLNSNLKRIAVYNEALSDTNLQSLTAS